MKKTKDLLSKIDGVIDVSSIPIDKRDGILDLESIYETGSVIELRNIGIKMVLDCSIVYAILKDTSFRSPPGPTVLMVDDLENGDEKTDQILKINDTRYHIIGEELIGKKLPEDEKYMFISDDFILYPGRRKGRSKNPAFFLVPPIAFRELEEVKDIYRIRNIISISPSTMADEYIRELCDFSTRSDLATILVGFDIEK